jgi:dihydroxyacetone kinase-like protein
MDAAQLSAWIREFAKVIAEQAQHLTELDAAIGDADHGINMDRGMTAVVAKLDDESPADIAGLCKLVAMTLISSVGGASGTLYGTFFLWMAGTVRPGEMLDVPVVVSAFRAGIQGVTHRGRAEPGDKTMLDSLMPAVDALDDALRGGADLPSALHLAAAAGAAGRDATAPIIARKGRASYLGERSVGHIDPGAASAALLIEALASVAGTTMTIAN